MSHLRLGTKTINLSSLGTNLSSFQNTIEELVVKNNIELEAPYIFKNDEYPFVEQIKDVKVKGSVGKPVYQFDFLNGNIGNLLTSIPGQNFFNEFIPLKLPGDNERTDTDVTIGYLSDYGVYLFLHRD